MIILELHDKNNAYRNLIKRKLTPYFQKEQRQRVLPPPSLKKINLIWYEKIKCIRFTFDIFTQKKMKILESFIQFSKKKDTRTLKQFLQLKPLEWNVVFLKLIMTLKNIG